MRAAHKRREEAIVAEGGELVGDRGVGRIVGAQELGMAGLGDVKEEDLILAPQNAEQATEGQRPPVVGEADMVRFVAYSASAKQRDRERNGPEDVPVARRVALKVDDGDEVWG